MADACMPERFYELVGPMRQRFTLLDSRKWLRPGSGLLFRDLVRQRFDQPGRGFVERRSRVLDRL